MRFQFNASLKKKSKFNDKFNNGTPIPLLVMYGKIVKETPKCYYVEVEGNPEESDVCMHCMRPLTDDISRLYGLGPKCGEYYGITKEMRKNYKENYKNIRHSLASVKWKGLIPKDKVSVSYESKTIITFRYQNKQYCVETSNTDKLEEIRERSDLILSEKVISY